MITNNITKHEKNLAAIIHASTFSKYFIPFGNFIIPLVLWTANKNEHVYVDNNGKQALNFQISMLLYSILLGVITIPIFVGFLTDVFDFDLFGFNRLNQYNQLSFNFNRDVDGINLGSWLLPFGIAGLLHSTLIIINIVYTILATLKANKGQNFEYPFTIQFIK